MGFLHGKRLYFIDDANAKMLSSFDTYPEVFLFIMYNTGAEYFHSNRDNTDDKAVTYRLRSRERNHSILHVYVNYMHKASVSVKIYSCEFMKEFDRYPRKVRKFVRQSSTELLTMQNYYLLNGTVRPMGCALI